MSPTDSPFAKFDLPDRPDTVRSPITPVLLALAVGVLVAGWLLAQWTGGDASTFANNLRPLVDTIPLGLINAAVGTSQVMVITLAVLCLVAVATARRLSRLVGVILASALSTLTLIAAAATSTAGTFTLSKVATDRGPWGFPSLIGVSVLTAALIVDSPWWSNSWRHMGRSVIAVAVLLRIAVAATEPSTLLVAIAAGAVGAQSSLLMIGRPNTRPRRSDVAAVLADHGFISTSFEDVGDSNGGFASLLATGTSTERLLIRIVCRDSWQAGFPSRVYRWVRYREADDDSPFTSMKRRVDREALGSLKNFADGVPTPRLTVFAPLGPYATLLAFDAVDGQLLADLAPQEWTKDLLEQLWSTVAKLRTNHTVHRCLSTEALVRYADGQVGIVNFRSSELGVHESELAVDVAEVLAATACIVGVDMAVLAATSALGTSAVASALPRLQPLALTPSTREAVKKAGCLNELTAQVRSRTGGADVPRQKLQRIEPRTLLLLAMTAAALWALIPQLLDAGDVWGLVRHANVVWSLAALAMSAFTYVAAAVAFAGSIPGCTPAAANIEIQLASSFASLASTVASMAIRAQFFYRRGLTHAVAVTSVAINTIAGIVAHLAILAAFIVLGGKRALDDFHAPSVTTMLLTIAGLLTIAAMLSLLRPVRALVRQRVMPQVRAARRGLLDVAGNSTKMTQLFGGSAALTVGYILTLAASVQAFGSELSFVTIALVYLVGSVVSAAAPTPGGLGAVEAALIAGLTAGGMRADVALAAVMLYRVVTFWLPLLPGWLAYGHLQRNGSI